MKKNLPFIISGSVIVAVIAASVFFLTAQGSARQKDGQGVAAKDTSARKAPDFSARDIFNTTNINLRDFAGKTVLVNFWATWCPPCRLEIPGLIALQKKYRDKFAIIGISVDQEGPEVVKKFYKDNKLNYPVIMATREMIAAYGGISAIPTSYLVDKNGKIVDMILGYRDEGQYEEIIKSAF